MNLNQLIVDLEEIKSTIREDPIEAESFLGFIIGEIKTAVQQSSTTDEAFGCPSCSLGLCPDNNGGYIPCTICGNTAQHKSLCNCGQLFPDNGYCQFCGEKK